MESSAARARHRKFALHRRGERETLAALKCITLWSLRREKRDSRRCIVDVAIVAFDLRRVTGPFIPLAASSPGNLPDTRGLVKKSRGIFVFLSKIFIYFY